MHFIFDLDGTIIDSKQEIINTYKIVFEEIQPVSIIDYNSLNFGATLNTILSEVYAQDSSKIDRAKKLFSSIYDSSLYTETLVYEGVVSTLSYLKENGYTLFIATNKRINPTQKILQVKRLDHYFTDILASDIDPEMTITKEKMIERVKNKYSIKKGFMVGDTHTDILAGKAQNLDTIAVTYGYENRDIFAVYNPTYIIESFNEITKIF